MNRSSWNVAARFWWCQIRLLIIDASIVVTDRRRSFNWLESRDFGSQWKSCFPSPPTVSSCTAPRASHFDSLSHRVSFRCRKCVVWSLVSSSYEWISLKRRTFAKRGRRKWRNSEFFAFLAASRSGHPCSRPVINSDEQKWLRGREVKWMNPSDDCEKPKTNEWIRSEISIANLKCSLTLLMKKFDVIRKRRNVLCPDEWA